MIDTILRMIGMGTEPEAPSSVAPRPSDTKIYLADVSRIVDLFTAAHDPVTDSSYTASEDRWAVCSGVGADEVQWNFARDRYVLKQAEQTEAGELTEVDWILGPSNADVAIAATVYRYVALDGQSCVAVADYLVSEDIISLNERIYCDCGDDRSVVTTETALCDPEQIDESDQDEIFMQLRQATNELFYPTEVARREIPGGE